ncbi:MDR family MFS transporter [Paenibacillus fonticola]|uniref:MDR family MFS transporter n=1 Tax=Paenibacillus fonticola TaxID=379896 RepID=UPI00035E650A|nr:MFS transporter [Paenibacillus fonticola]
MNSSLKHIHPLAWTIIVGTIFGRTATSMSIPFLSIYLIRSMGATPAQTGMVVAVSSLIGVFASFYGGYISDIIGRKKVLYIAIFGWVLVFAGFAYAHQIWMFFIMNALNGLCRATFEPTSRALLADITPKESKLLVFNLRYAAINMGVVVGPLLGLRVGVSNSNSVFLIAAIVYACYSLGLVIQFSRYREIGLAAGGKEQRIGLTGALKATSGNRTFMLVLAGMIFCLLGYGHFDSTLTQYMELSPQIEEGVTWFSYLISLNAIVVLTLQYPLVRFASRFAPALPIIAGNLFIAISLVMFGMFHSLPLLMICVVIFTIGEVLVFTSTDVLVDRIADPELRGAYFGMFGFNNLGAVLAPLLGGFLLDGLGVASSQLIFLILGLTTACGIPFLFTAHRSLSRLEQKRVSQEGVSF